MKGLIFSTVVTLIVLFFAASCGKDPEPGPGPIPPGPNSFTLKSTYLDITGLVTDPKDLDRAKFGAQMAIKNLEGE